MKLHTNTKLYRQAITVTSQQMKMSEIYIEKDYWITYALYSIFSSKIGTEAIFKGGTALSKCYNLIERFSEDIDLVVLRKDKESGNQLKSKLKKITQLIIEPFVEEDLEGITNKMGMVRKVAYNYPKTFEGNFGQVRNRIIIEATWLGYFEPYTTKEVKSYIYDMMIETKQEKEINEYNLQPFNVLALAVERTLCEKIMSLVRFSYSEDPILDLNNKIRHTYDIYKLLENKEIKAFFNSSDFDKMMLKVGQDDVNSFKNNNKWLKNHPKDALLFADTARIWKQMTKTYQTSFKHLVFGTVPKESDILNSILEVAKRLKEIAWTIEID